MSRGSSAMRVALLVALCHVAVQSADDDAMAKVNKKAMAKEKREKGMEEKRKKWDDLFPKIDVNHDDKLSQAEVTAYMQSGHHLLTKSGKAEAIKSMKSKTEAEFASLDADSDGVLSTDEMANSDDRAKRNLRRRGDSKPIDIDAYVVLKNPQFADDEATYVHFLAMDLMDSWDTDGDESLTFEEYDAMKKKERDNVNKFTKSENKKTGVITISFGGPSDEEMETRKAKDDADFKDADEDSNGAFSRSEFELYLRTKGEAKWAAEVEEFFEFSDGNKDGVLELEEVHHNVDFMAVSKVMNHRNSLRSEL
jgi:Ca2+-binding EF-hand superfamily protein